MVRNPFYVFGLTPAARPAEIALRYRALQAQLRQSRPIAFETPAGFLPLDEGTLERALTDLRDPDARLEHELRYVPAARRKTTLKIVTTP